jgi:GNAT superfamily N-acetyltransferase
MHLTPPIPLDFNNVTLDAFDLARIRMTFPNSSPFDTLRWGSVSDSDMLTYLLKRTSDALSIDATFPRIGAAQDDKKGQAIERREHLVIRDLDLLPRRVEEHPEDYDAESPARKLGRIVTHAEYRFRPKGWNWRDPTHNHPHANGEPVDVATPPGANAELIELFNERVKELLDYHCKGGDCYELVEIATHPSHLRKGLAKQLVTWLFRFCDEDHLDYKLMASPMGKGLYKSCGFVEDGKGDKGAVEIDMAEWGGEGIHRHVHMARHPEKLAS